MSTFTPEKASADIGVYGLGVMGANLARNLARNGYATAVFNRTPARTEKLMAEHGDEATSFPRPRWKTSSRPCARPASPS